jgi:hypothetical protein
MEHVANPPDEPTFPLSCLRWHRLDPADPGLIASPKFTHLAAQRRPIPPLRNDCAPTGDLTFVLHWGIFEFLKPSY